jgi:hypothetical protein
VGREVIELLRDPTLRAMKAEFLGRVPGAMIRWFRPDVQFWVHLSYLRSTMPGVALVDCGTGSADLPREATAKGFAMIGVDLQRRSGENPILIADSIDFPFSPTVWPIICRPCHDGFAELTFENAFKAGAGGIYVGLTKNVENDLGDQRRRFKCMLGTVGEEGERLWFAKPRAKRGRAK